MEKRTEWYAAGDFSCILTDSIESDATTHYRKETVTQDVRLVKLEETEWVRWWFSVPTTNTTRTMLDSDRI
jgi:hypothetical protein